jgi:hypothetical protein
MRHKHFKELLQLSMYDELTATEHTALDAHLMQCPECRKELEELKRFHETLAQAGAVTPDDSLLSEARQELRSALRKERSRSSLWTETVDLVKETILPHYKVVLGAAGMLAAGILIGRLILPTGEPPFVQQPEAEKVSAFLEGDTRIANIRFISPSTSTGDIEFTFDAISPVHMKGNINDARVQKVLAHALVNDHNPGVRLRSASAFAAQALNLKQPDKEVKAALIRALRTDENPGVRKEAMRTLQNFPFDQEIKQAFLDVLMRDKNPALRIAAINSLDSGRVQGQQTDKDLLEVLKERMQADENNYIRIRAKAVLEEVRQ